MSGQRVLIVEDDPDIREMIEYNLGKEGYETMSCGSGQEVAPLAKTCLPDIIILDLMLPEVDGLEVCRILKGDEATRLMPVIMLTAKSQETDKIVGLELGADDYITKPFSPRELIARIRAVLRRTGNLQQERRILAGELEIDSLRYRVRVSGRPVALTASEFKLLHYLAQKPGEVLSREQILNGVFGYRSDVYDRTVDTHIKTLRKKLGSAKEYIETVRGMGYRFRET